MDIFLDEVIALNRIIPGLFTFSDLRDMAFDDYEKVLTKAKKIGREHGQR